MRQTTATPFGSALADMPAAATPVQSSGPQAAPAPAGPILTPPLEIPPYSPSGKVTLVGTILLILVTLILAPVVGIGYAVAGSAAGEWAFGKMGFVMAMLFGLLLSGGYFFACQVGKIRNPIVLGGFALIGALLAFFVRTEVDAGVMLASAPPSVQAEAHGPISAFTTYISLMSDGGLVDVTDGTKTGTPVTGADFWFEFLFPQLGLLIAPFIAWGAGRREFCEKCRKWMKVHKLVHNSAQAAPKLRELTVAGNWDALRRFPKMGNFDTKSYSTVNLFHCLGCGDASIEIKMAYGSKVKPIFRGSIDSEASTKLMAKPGKS
jgi:hypothetical protein